MSNRWRSQAALLVPLAGGAVAAAAIVWAQQPWRGSPPSTSALFSLALFSFAVLPHILVALGLLLGRSVGWLWWSALIYGVLASAGGIVIDISILTSDSSTAALGFLSLPAFQLVGLFLAAAIGGLTGWLSGRRRDHTYSLR